MLLKTGGSYREFSAAFKEYLSSANAVSDQEIASEMRRILKGEELTKEDLYFIPNLIAAWFVSEPSRYENSHLFGLMLLDLVEAGIRHYDSEGNNLHQWVHTLTHPLKPDDSRVNLQVYDLYENPIELARIDGLHPMAHGAGTGKKGSVKQSQEKLANNQELSPVHQKEGHILIAWLSQYISSLPNDRSVDVGSAPLTKSPEYDEIEKILSSQGTKPSKSIGKDAHMSHKWKIVHEILVPAFHARLCSFDIVLPMDVGHAKLTT